MLHMHVILDFNESCTPWISCYMSFMPLFHFLEVYVHAQTNYALEKV